MHAQEWFEGRLLQTPRPSSTSGYHGLEDQATQYSSHTTSLLHASVGHFDDVHYRLLNLLLIGTSSVFDQPGCRYTVILPPTLHLPYRGDFVIMVWPLSFEPQDKNRRTCWGYTFHLTPEHLTPEEMKPMKLSYDRLGEQALDRLNLISPPPRSALPRNTKQFATPGAHEGESNFATGPMPKRDLYLLLREHAAKDDVLGQLWLEVNTVPDWVNWDQIARGQDVFYRYGGPALTGLAFQSLLGGMVRI